MGRKRLKNNITLKNIWHTYPYRYNKKSPFYIERTAYVNISKDFFQELMTEIIENAYEYKLPNRLGILRVKKFKGLKRQIDWKLTNKYYAEENQAGTEKKRIYHSNTHSSGYNARFWIDPTMWVSYNKTYTFIATRKNKRDLARAIKDENVIIKYRE